MAKTSIFDERIARYQKRTDFLRTLAKAIDQDPTLLRELSEIIEEYEKKNIVPAVADPLFPDLNEDESDHREMEEDNDDENVNENDTPLEIRKGTKDFEEYKAKVGAVVLKALEDSEYALSSLGLFRAISGSVTLRPENNNPKGLGKLLPLLVKDGIIERFRSTKNNKWYYRDIPSSSK
jgi:hypothetical protein